MATKTRKDYDLTTASGAIDAWKNARSGIEDSYNDSYASQIGSVMGELRNSEFKYNPGTDPTFQIYRRQYADDAQKSMKDTLGKATSLTGGYNNSYAQLAGQQAYDEKMGQLEAIIPQLRQQAIDNWRADRADKYNYLSALQGESDRGYNRWLTGQQMLRDEANGYLDMYRDNRGFEYQQGRDKVADDQWQRSFDYQKSRDKVADDQWRQSFDYQVNRDNIADDQWRKSYELDQQQAAASASAAAAKASGSSKSSSWWEKLGFSDGSKVVDALDGWAQSGEEKFISNLKALGLDMATIDKIYAEWFPANKSGSSSGKSDLTRTRGGRLAK